MMTGLSSRGFWRAAQVPHATNGAMITVQGFGVWRYLDEPDHVLCILASVVCGLRTGETDGLEGTVF